VTPDPLFSNAQALQFDFDLGKSETFTAPEIEFDLGVDALGIEVDLQPEISIDFNLHVGFGVDQHDGFYFVTDFDRDGDEVLDDELSLDIVIDFGSTPADPASATGRLVVLALMATTASTPMATASSSSATLPCMPASIWSIRAETAGSASRR